jgi:hypothetical protein
MMRSRSLSDRSFVATMHRHATKVAIFHLQAQCQMNLGARDDADNTAHFDC